MRKLLFVLFSFFVFTISAQTLPKGMSASKAAQAAKAASKEQLQSYIKQAKEQGYNLTQVKSIIRAQGASLSDVALLEELWSQPAVNTEATANEKASLNSSFGLFGSEEREEDKTESLFRKELINHKS